MNSAQYKISQLLYNKLISLKLTIEGLESLKDQRINKVILVINNVKNPILVTDLSKKISDQIVDLLIKHKTPLYDQYKKDFEAI